MSYERAARDLLSARCSTLTANAQVGEWLKPADCKSAPPRRYEGSNPSLCTRVRCDEKIGSGAVGICGDRGAGSQDAGQLTHSDCNAADFGDVRVENLGAAQRCVAHGER